MLNNLKVQKGMLLLDVVIKDSNLIWCICNMDSPLNYATTFLVRKVSLKDYARKVQQTEVYFKDQKSIKWPSFYVRKDGKSAVISGRRHENSNSY
jgi:hypothetical protein